MDTESEEEAQYDDSGSKKQSESRIREGKVPNASFPLLEYKNEDLSTLHKIHAILLNCINLNERQKLEFCSSQRYFMKLYLKKLRDKLRIE